MIYLIYIFLISHSTMEFFASLMAFALSQGFNEAEVVQAHQNYCQNLYFQPDSITNMEKYGCDIHTVSNEIERVTSGKY